MSYDCDNIREELKNEKVYKLNKITSDAKATIVECSNETFPKIQSTVDFKRILIYINCVINTHTEKKPLVILTILSY